MSPVVSAKDPLRELEEHLASQMADPQRSADFDMNDGPEAAVLAPFTELQSELEWLKSNLTTRWFEVDREALRCQWRHQRLARIAIATGTAAIILAVIQLSLKLTLPSLAFVALLLEAVAVAAAVIAVGVGIGAKFDRRWLGQRHHAERLRMLKFRSLAQLWCLQPQSWRAWVTEQLSQLEGADDFGKVEQWSREGEVEPDLASSVGCEPNANFARALTIYYRFKRVEFQADYFKRRRETYERQTDRWRHLNLPVFLVGVFCVIAHFALEFHASRLAQAGGAEAARLWESLAVWFVALAAIIPILGAGVRAWFAAFELPRSASLFAAKHRALGHLVNHLKDDSGRVLPTLHHMAQVEHFLEHEHREWLRLLLDTEWFL